MVLCCAFAISGASFAHAAMAADFAALLKESGLSFSPPGKAKEITPARLPFFDFDKAYRHGDPEVEIHYAVRPIARMETTSYDAHGATPEPNYLYTMIFKSLSGNLAESTRYQRRNYAPDLAKELFHAGWAAAAQFSTAKAIGRGYANGILLALHKKDRADVFTLFLFNDARAAKPFINAHAAALKFKPEAESR